MARLARMKQPSLAAITELAAAQAVSGVQCSGVGLHSVSVEGIGWISNSGIGAHAPAEGKRGK